MRQNAEVGVVASGAEAIVMPAQEVYRNIATEQREPGEASARRCEVEAREYWFVSHALSGVTNFDLWLDEQVRQSRPELLRPESKFLGDTCVINPFWHDPIREH